MPPFPLTLETDLALPPIGPIGRILVSACGTVVL